MWIYVYGIYDVRYKLIGSWFVLLTSGWAVFSLCRCKCGFCEVGLLVDPMECHCCHEIKECGLALEDKLVLDEVGSKPKCVTLHPGFNPCCLSKWSLRVAGSKLRIPGKKALAKEEYVEYLFSQIFESILSFDTDRGVILVETNIALNKIWIILVHRGSYWSNHKCQIQGYRAHGNRKLIDGLKTV